MTNQRVVLARRPHGAPRLEDFRLEEVPVPAPDPGQVLCRTIYLSLDPYMRGRLREERSYARRVELGEVIVGGTVGQVVESRHPGFRTGDFVLGAGGWQTFAVAEGRSLRRLDPEAAPLSTALGVLGMPGLTAWVGLLDIGRPRPGQTVVVSAAAGAVGSVVGQLAKIQGCRAVGVAGTPDKCRWVVEALGFDAAVCHRSDDLVGALREACPDGIDVYFDNVGGRVLEAVLRLVNVGARIPLCGLVAEYNAPEPPPGPNLRPVLFNRVTIQGFIVSDHAHREPQFLEDMGRWVREGRVRYREDIVEGLARAPEAFIGLLEGRNFGKLLVRVTPDPTRR
ncbi:MAG TPA: NADP-dependent oxidoreductase [Calidithermus sp.]|nr:NADP-dependent oxidoreductase [Calidithermus sp.]